MLISTNMKKNFNLVIICIISNLFFSQQAYETYEIIINPDSDSEEFYINDSFGKSPCQRWIPSLFTPFLLVPKENEIEESSKLFNVKLEIKLPFINDNKFIFYEFYQNIPFLNDKFQSLLMRPIVFQINKCYLGISASINGYENFEEKNTTLNILKENKLIDEKIFSFDIWRISSEYKEAKSKLFLGESINIFNSNDRIEATCENYPGDLHWGCSFKEMILDNISFELKNENQSLYKTYISSEIPDLILPNFLKQKLVDLFKKECIINDYNYLTCKTLFNNSNYAPLKLIEENENFIIKGQIDNINRFNKEDQEKKNISRITFEEIDYIILPLMVFKQFHIQFNAEKKLISFYTNDSSILEVRKKGKNESSSIGKVFLIIFIILIILCICFVVYWIIKRRQLTEKNINHFSKFEDEEDYHTINEKKVF